MSMIDPCNEHKKCTKKWCNDCIGNIFNITIEIHFASNHSDVFLSDFPINESMNYALLVLILYPL